MTVVSYKVLRHHYKDEWGEHQDWVTKRAKRREERNWKNDLAEELESMDEHESAFLIMNEWTANDEDDMTEIVALFHTENGAWGELYEIAKEFDIILDPDDTSFSPPGAFPDINESYYIEERQFND